MKAPRVIAIVRSEGEKRCVCRAKSFTYDTPVSVILCWAYDEHQKPKPGHFSVGLVPDEGE